MKTAALTFILLLSCSQGMADTSRPESRRIENPKHGSPAIYTFKYSSPDSWNLFTDSISIFDLNGNFQRTYQTQVSKNFLLKHQAKQKQKPLKVLIVDTGFEWTHPDLIDKHYVNKGESLNGLDDDGDGLIDNLTTLKGLAGAGGGVTYTFNENEQIRVNLRGGEPLSHGTFVASVAMKDIDHISFLGASGSLDSPVLIFKLIELIRAHSIQFSNLSFGFGDKASVSLMDPEGHDAIESFLKSTPETLHAVAAGNRGVDFDNSSFSEYPACFKSKNILTVGAVNTDEIRETELPTLKRSAFSSYGVRCVDIYAPGEEMVGAGLYPFKIKAGGTSVASPYILNLAIKVAHRAPSLTASEIRTLILQTAFVPAEGALPVRSGGIVFPKRALKAADIFTDGSSLEDSIQLSRTLVTAFREETDFEFLSNLWAENNRHRHPPRSTRGIN